MTEKRNQDGALKAIHEEALKLMALDVPENMRDGLELIRSLAHYEFDLRSDGERKRSFSETKRSNSTRK